MIWLADFQSLLTEYRERLLSIAPEQAEARPESSKWSIKEIIGHLIDSASNNHQRFVRSQWQNNLVFSPYAQDDWVHAQHYQEAPWRELVELWYYFNRHIVRVIQSTPASIRERATVDHNFDRIAWKAVPKGTPSTLAYFMKDYADHLKSHLTQVDAILKGYGK